MNPGACCAGTKEIYKGKQEDSVQQRCIAATGCPTASPSLSAVRECSRRSIGEADQNWTQQQRRKWIDHPQNQNLCDDVEKNRDCYEIAHSDESTAHQFSSPGRTEDQGPEERRLACASISSAITYSEDDGDGGLKDEAQAARTVKSRNHVVEESLREYVELAGAGQLPDRKWQGEQKHDCH